VIEFGKKFEYNTNTKRNISKAIKSGLTVIELADKETREVSKKNLNPFLKNKLKLSTADIKIFDQLLVNSIKEQYLKTLTVMDADKNILALAHFISNGKHAVYLKGTAFDKTSGAMHFLMDHAINFYKSKGVELFDFGGGQSESMARFYSGFGAKELLYKLYQVNNLPKPLKWIKK
jgi:lipid II:glycine glycyltransferase (peptidoglycan interpeptide bridge formation enzyme)